MSAKEITLNSRAQERLKSGIDKLLKTELVLLRKLNWPMPLKTWAHKWQKKSPAKRRM